MMDPANFATKIEPMLPQAEPGILRFRDNLPYVPLPPVDKSFKPQAYPMTYR